jgi:hypothetical protein
MSACRGLVMLSLSAALCGAVSAQPAETATESLTAAGTGTGDQRAELKEVLPQNRLLGKSRLRIWGFQVYDARLWVAPGFRADRLTDSAFALELDYLRAFDAIDVAERSILEMRRTQAIDDTQAKTWIAQMLRVIPNVKKGDRIMGVNKPGVGVLYLVNGKPTGEIHDLEFARLFFGIWLSPKTSEPQLRSALLGGAG